jgi:hypothetical protein
VVSELPPKLSTAGQVAAAIVMIPMLSVLGYGLVFFSDGPYRECAAATGYCGKHFVHTLAEYQACGAWQAILVVVWIVGILLLGLIGLADRKTATSTRQI